MSVSSRWSRCSGPRRRWAAAALLLALCAGQAWAAPEDPATTEAKRHFEEGSKAFALGEFPRAIQEYRAAFNAKPDPVFLYNIAQAYRLSNDLRQALFFYKSFLSNMPDAPNRRAVEQRIRDTEAQLAKQREITEAPPNVPVTPAVVASAHPAPAVTTPPAISEPPAVTPPPAPPPAEPAPAVAATSAVEITRAPPRRTPVYKKWWLWTAVGAGAVAIGLGVGLGLGLRAHTTVPQAHFGVDKVFQ